MDESFLVKRRWIIAFVETLTLYLCAYDLKIHYIVIVKTFLFIYRKLHKQYQQLLQWVNTVHSEGDISSEVIEVKKEIVEVQNEKFI